MVLPDVKEDHVFYHFKGEESWQPLTKLPSKRCKLCGFYEENSFVSDDVYEEWEFCPNDFTEPDGKYIRFKEKEFNANFFMSKVCSFCKWMACQELGTSQEALRSPEDLIDYETFEKLAEQFF